MSEAVQDQPMNQSEATWMEATHISNALPNEGVYVAFTSPTCGPCASMKPILERVGNELGRHLFIIDVTQVKGLAVAFNIRAVPTVLRLVDGTPQVPRMIGGQPEQVIRDFMKV
jgi:thioredoxin-like negative regulator of GroEL